MLHILCFASFHVALAVTMGLIRMMIHSPRGLQLLDRPNKRKVLENSILWVGGVGIATGARVRVKRLKDFVAD